MYPTGLNRSSMSERGRERESELERESGIIGGKIGHLREKKNEGRKVMFAFGEEYGRMLHFIGLCNSVKHPFRSNVFFGQTSVYRNSLVN